MYSTRPTILYVTILMTVVLVSLTPSMQAEIVWEKTWDGGLGIFGHPLSIGVDVNGNISLGIFAATTWDAEYERVEDYAYGAVSYEPDGTLRWGRVLQSGLPRDAVTSRDGYVFLTGENGTVGVDPEGTTIWTQPGFGMFVDCDTLGNVFVAGDVISCYDAYSGGIKWSETIAGKIPSVSGVQHREGIRADNKGGVYLPVRDENGGDVYELYKLGVGAWAAPRPTAFTVQYVDVDSDGNALVLAVNNNLGSNELGKYAGSDGSLLWEHTAGEGWTNAICTDGDNNVFVLDPLPMVVMKFSQAGDSLWTADLGAVSLNYNRMTTDGEGNLYLAAALGFPNLHDFFVTRISPDGNINYRELMPTAENSWLAKNTFIDVDDSGYVYATVGQTTKSSLPAGLTRVVKLGMGKSITVRDANNDTIPNTEFELIRITNDIPTFTADTLGMFTTDAWGSFEFNSAGVDMFEVELSTGTHQLAVGDSLKISKHLHDEPAVKHPSLLPTMYSVHLDNAKFAEDGTMWFDSLTSDNQDVVLDHSEFRYNLVVSVQWDAKLDYLGSLEGSFRWMADYMYDVTDGQARLDTVLIYDDEEHWLEADMQIFASNMERPRAYTSGINVNTPGWTILYPRVWFGSEVANRNFGYDAYPYDLGDPDNYRTYAHEFGHYAFGFYDEYRFVDGSGILNETDRCGRFLLEPYGYMDSPFEVLGDRATEMSSAFTYDDLTCRNTQQYVVNGMSCWDFLELTKEGHYGPDNVFAPIHKPDDRPGGVPPSVDYFPGPNDGMYSNYDVMFLLETPVSHTAPTTFDIDVVTHDWATNRLGNVDVVLKKPLSGVLWSEIPQGRTSDVSPDGLSGGGIYVLGAESGDQIVASTDYTVMGIASSSLALTDVGGVSWMVGSATIDQDNLSLNLQPIAGNWPLVCDIAIGENTSTLSITAERSFSELPGATINPESGSQQTYGLSANALGYDLEFSDNLGSMGAITVTAIDDSSSEFFFRMPYTVTLLDDSTPGWLLGPNGGCELMLDNSQSGLSHGMILSSPYPVIRTGLDPIAMQAGDAHAFAPYPADSLSGDHSILIRYSDADLKAGSDLTGDESTLRVYKWVDQATGWQYLGSTVDTTENVVYSQIDSAGVYAAFTTDVITGVDDDEYGGILPYQFELLQNYPNPFNPTTTIEYSLPKRSYVTIEVFNLLGQKVRSLVGREVAAGSHTITWDGADAGGEPVATGVYLYRFQAGDHVETKKMLLLK